MSKLVETHPSKDLPAAAPSVFLGAALQYVARGWPVFPLKPRSKAPLGEVVPHGFLNATRNRKIVSDWWTRYPEANIAIPTGRAIGAWVLDADCKNGLPGLDTLEQLRTERQVRNTLQQITGSGGKQLFFDLCGLDVPSFNQKRTVLVGLDGCDIKGDGGYVVVPPSVHPDTMREYTWDGLDDFSKQAILEPSGVLLQALARLIEGDTSETERFALEAEVPEGQRNDVLYKYACSLRGTGGGLEFAEIVDALLAANRARCKPPLPDAEVRRIAESASKHPKGNERARVISMPARIISGASDDGVGRGDDALPALRGYAYTDTGNAERLVSRHGARIRYCHPQRAWQWWDGRRWQPDRSGQMMHFVKCIARDLYDEASRIQDDSQRKLCATWALRSESSDKKKAALVSAQSEPGIPILPEEFDRDPFLLNCLNGTIDLTSGELRPHRREDLISKLCPVKYDAGARSQLWDRFLNEVTEGDRELQNFLQRAVGYSLTGDVSEEVLFFLHGPAATGKSTFLESVKAVLGDYAKTADFETFVQRSQAGGVRDDIAELAGRRFVVSIEVDQGQKLAEGLTKLLTGGDTVRARLLYQQGFEFSPQFKLWLAANHEPRVKHDDSAMWRRILRVPFECVVRKERRDPTVKRRLKDIAECGPAILSWGVEGCLRWREERLGVPAVVEEATEAYRQDMDPLQNFITDCCVLLPTAWGTAAAIRKAYEEYCRQNGEKHVLGPREFAEGLRSRGCNRERRHIGHCWLGIGLAADNSTAGPSVTP